MNPETYKKRLARIKSVAVYCGSKDVADVAFAEAVVSLGKFLAAHGMTLVFGGSNVGTMKLLADTVLANGGQVVGVFTKNLKEGLLHPGLTEAIVTETLAERKAEMLKRADALIALPGSYGTWDELFDALALRKVQCGGHKCPVGILNVNGYYDHLLKFIEHSTQVGFTSRRFASLLKSAPRVEDLFIQLAGNLV